MPRDDTTQSSGMVALIVMTTIIAGSRALRVQMKKSRISFTSREKSPFREDTNTMNQADSQLFELGSSDSANFLILV